MSTEYSDVHNGKPDHIDLTAHHTREPDILGKCQILYYTDAIGPPHLSTAVAWSEKFTSILSFTNIFVFF